MTESQKFEYFRCMTCGFSGSITEPEIAKHRSRCAGGTTEAFSRLEAIRQIEEEMRELEWWKDSCAKMAIAHMRQGNDAEANEYIMPTIRHARTLARLEAWRDEMKRGMK